MSEQPPMLVRSREDGRVLRGFRAALIVGGAILVWVAIVAIAITIYAGVDLADELGVGDDPTTFTDSNGNTCELYEVEAVPEPLCPASLNP